MATKREWKEEAKDLRAEVLGLHRECREERLAHERTREAMLEAIQTGFDQKARIADLEKGRDERVRELEDMVAVRDSRAYSLVEREQAGRRYMSTVRALYPEAHRGAFNALGWLIVDEDIAPHAVDAGETLRTGTRQPLADAEALATARGGQ